MKPETLGKTGLFHDRRPPARALTVAGAFLFANCRHLIAKLLKKASPTGLCINGS